MIKNYQLCLAKVSAVKEFIKKLQRLTSFDVVLVSSEQDEAFNGSLSKLYDGPATYIVTSRLLECQIAPLDKTSSNATKPTGGKKRGLQVNKICKDTIEIQLPEHLSPSECKEFLDKVQRRSIIIRGWTVPPNFFDQFMALNLDLVCQHYQEKLAGCADVDLLKAGLSASEILAWKRRSLFSDTSVRHSSALLPDTFWGMLLFFPEYRDRVKGIMTRVFTSMREQEKSLIRLAVFFGIFAPDHGIAVTVAQYILSCYDDAAFPNFQWSEYSNLSSFFRTVHSSNARTNTSTSTIHFRCYHMVYAWADILYDTSSSSDKLEVKLMHFIDDHFRNVLLKKKELFLGDRAVLSAMLSFFCDNMIWHYFPNFPRLSKVSDSEGNMLSYSEEFGKHCCLLRNSFMVEFLFGTNYDGYLQVEHLYEFVEKELLPYVGRDADVELGFSRAIRTHFARILTRRAETTSALKLLDSADKVLDAIPESDWNDKYYERKGAIERAKIRILLKHLKCELFVSGLSSAQYSKKCETLAPLVIKDNMLVCAAEAAEKYFVQAMKCSNFCIPHSMVALVQTWLNVLDVLRLLLADQSHQKCFQQLQAAKVFEPGRFVASVRTQFDELLGTLHGKWIFNRISKHLLQAHNTLHYRSEGKYVNERQTRKELTKCKSELNFYESQEIAKLERTGYSGPPFEWWIASYLWKSEPFMDAKGIYCLIAANNRCVDSIGKRSGTDASDLFVGLELLFRVATVCQRSSATRILLPETGKGVQPFIWENPARLKTCLNDWFKAATDVVLRSNINVSVKRTSRSTTATATAAVTAAAAVCYHGLTPAFALLAQLIYICVFPDLHTHTDRVDAITDLTDLLQHQWKERFNWHFNKEARYFVTSSPKIEGFSFSMLLKKDYMVNYDQSKFPSIDSYLQHLRSSQSSTFLFVFHGTVKVFRGGQQDVPCIACRELEIDVKVPSGDSMSNLENWEGHLVSFYIGIAGSRLVAYGIRKEENTLGV